MKEGGILGVGSRGREGSREGVEGEEGSRGG